MSSTSFSALLAEAEAAGLQTWVPESGPYTLEIVGGNFKKAKSGAPGFGLRFKVVGGPDDGKSYWDNFYLAGGQSTAITLKTWGQLGVSSDQLAKLEGPIEDNADKVIALFVGTVFACDLSVKQNGDFQNYSYRDIELEDRSPAASPAPAPADATAAPAPGVDDDDF